MKSAIDDNAESDLYTFLESTIDAITSYNVPFSCKEDFAELTKLLGNLVDDTAVSTEL